MSSASPKNTRSTEKEVITLHGKWNGQTTSSPAILTGGNGMVLTRTALGTYRITLDKTWDRHLATHVQLEATTPADLAGHTVVMDSFSATLHDFIVYTNGDVPVDLVSGEHVNITVFVSDDQ